MKHVVVVWGTDLQTEDELQAFLEPVYTEDGDMYPSEFMKATGLTWIDEDFFEVHALGKAEERANFLEYLRQECVSAGASSAEKLPASLSDELADYPTVLLLYGQQTTYGTVNEELFSLSGERHVASTQVKLLAKIEYEG
ncbi:MULTISPECIES: immunity 22 family protein [Brevibacillus]|uniref:immunity 22 family protein n=1 Tax=Brevibacillus TaxID=55080 RepID=UPI0007ABEF2B|nr:MULTISPECIES: immunity 22 family protein [Brevibacillus]KZE41892.1 hypothetical protein AV540_02420 [Brevibacillus parabrevis]HBZ80239.1 hypothetical protein [Brevibacillus sp.]